MAYGKVKFNKAKAENGKASIINNRIALPI